MNLELVDLTLPKSGFRKFISSWIIEYDSKVYVVDPGPTNSLSTLVTALNGRIPDYILLTHIHIDHAGGVGDLPRLYPNVKIICYSKAIKHLINPANLIEGSKKVAGDLMQTYGDILPVNENSIISHEQFKDFEIIETPGHASHHISYKIGDYLFCGEALGIILNTDSALYIRPATPPPFKLDIYLQSIDKLSKIKAKKLCFGHFGQIDFTDEIFLLAKNQIQLWIDIVRDHPNNPLDKLLDVDLNFLPFKNLPEDIKERELIFLDNTISGIKDYLENII